MRGRLLLVLCLLLLCAMPSLGWAFDPAFAVPVLRPSAGASWIVSGEREDGFALHVPVGALVGWAPNGLARLFDRTPFLLPELGYELRVTKNHRSDAFSAGLGVGYGVLTLAIVSYTPRFTVGSSDGQTALGFRHSVAGHFLLSVIYLELSHEVLRAGAITSHDIQLSAGLNVGTLLIPLFF
ncbi:MAG TPA: hypothetical protein PKI49_13870 [Pseudomonadota bacterium]|jgi:hypothetical protein|nr:hypothetical protein [Pseudomonadota bacterium]HNN52873.1 hypothetical protein [Pseudomonadota bacterium]HNO69597.1 hypothetical protein [Pseudomonadota bacterium]